MMILCKTIYVKIYETKVLYREIYLYHSYSIFGLTLGHEFCWSARHTSAETRRVVEGGVRCYDHPPRCVAIPLASREPYFQIVRCVLDWRVRCVCFIVLRCIAVYCGFRRRGGRGRVYFAIGTRVADWLARVVDLNDCNAAGFERFRWE